MSKIKLLVCDLDNTLYDWLNYFVPSFYAMVDVAVSITGCSKESLLNDFQKVHQSHGDSEQPFALIETDTIRKLYRGFSEKDILKALDPAFHAFNSSRKRNLRLHNNVRETLDFLLHSGVILVAHTESKLYGVVDRLQRLDLHRYFSRIYCRERSLSSFSISSEKALWLDKFPMEKVIELAHHEMKPNPTVLLEICAREGVTHENAAYVGDSIARDMLMAKRAEVFAIWAAYGARHSSELYSNLVRISHWSSKEVSTELRLKEEARTIRPDYVANHSFAEVIAALQLDNRLYKFASY